jgi:hypothetical protein
MARVLMKTFMFGALAGGVTVWMYSDRLRAYLGGHLDTVRAGLLDVLDAVSDTLDTVRDRLEAGRDERHAGTDELGALAGAERAERRGVLGGTGAASQ